MSLLGKTILITGAASGIGLATAKELLKHGVKGIVILDLDSAAGEAAIRTLSEENSTVLLKFIKTDVGDENQVKDAYKQANKTFGYIDIVINAAGIYNDKKWQLQIQVNLVGVINSTLQALECMRSDKGGKGGIVINVSSKLGYMPIPFVPLYSATKFAVQGMSRCFGDPIYATKTGVNVFTVCPGVTSSNMFHDDILNTVFDETIVTKADQAEAFKNFKMQTPEEAAKGIVKAAVDGEAGDVWVVDGGEVNKIKISFENI